MIKVLFCKPSKKCSIVLSLIGMRTRKESTQKVNITDIDKYRHESMNSLFSFHKTFIVIAMHHSLFQRPLYIHISMGLQLSRTTPEIIHHPLCVFSNWIHFLLDLDGHDLSFFFLGQVGGIGSKRRAEEMPVYILVHRLINCRGESVLVYF